jgi:fido (protein-threonine AMPylation protein)
MSPTIGSTRARFFLSIARLIHDATADAGNALAPSPCIPLFAEKAAALCLALVQSHPFVDGNKRVGHAAMETFLVLNGTEIDPPSMPRSALYSISPGAG